MTLEMPSVPIEHQCLSALFLPASSQHPLVTVKEKQEKRAERTTMAQYLCDFFTIIHNYSFCATDLTDGVVFQGHASHKWLPYCCQAIVLSARANTKEFIPFRVVTLLLLCNKISLFHDLSLC